MKKFSLILCLTFGVFSSAYAWEVNCISEDKNFKLNINIPQLRDDQIVATVSSQSESIQMNCIQEPALNFICSEEPDQAGAKNLIMQIRPADQTIFLGYYFTRGTSASGGKLITHFFNCKSK